MFFNNCHYSIKLYISITISISLALSISVLFILILQFINGTQFLNIIPIFLSTACLPAASSLAPVIVILPLISMHASL